MTEKKPRLDLVYILVVIFLCLFATLWLVSLILGILKQGICGYAMLIVVLGILGIFFKLLQERLNNKDDDFYDKNISK